MKKLSDLRLFLLKNVAHLESNPDSLHTWINSGKSHGTDGGYSFSNDYEIICLINNYAGDINKLLTPFNVWVKDNIPNRKNNELIDFETAVIDHEKTDVSITIKVRNDSVIVNDTGDGFKQCDDLKDNINNAVGL